MSAYDDIYLGNIETHAETIAASAHRIDVYVSYLSNRYDFSTAAEAGMAKAENKLAEVLESVRQARAKFSALKVAA